MDVIWFIAGLILGVFIGFALFYLYLRRLTKKLTFDFAELDKLMEEMFKAKR